MWLSSDVLSCAQKGGVSSPSSTKDPSGCPVVSVNFFSPPSAVLPPAVEPWLQNCAVNIFTDTMPLPLFQDALPPLSSPYTRVLKPMHCAPYAHYQRCSPSYSKALSQLRDPLHTFILAGIFSFDPDLPSHWLCYYAS